ncbi:MAG: HamA C-terminal domain-containing protein [Mycobacteriaceae bacterium]
MTADAAEQAAEALGDHAWLTDTLAEAARGRASSVDAFLHHVEPARAVGTYRATCRTHFVVCGPDGQPRVEELCRRLAAEVMDFCIPRSRIDEAAKEYAEYGSTLSFGRLQDEARSLFTSLMNSGEGGELLLYMLLETVLRVPQVLCKMPLKTSSQMHVHGADGVHALAKPDGGLALYWGESKLFSSAADAVRECLDSLAGFLLGGSDARRRDMLLLRDHASLEDPALTQALRAFFDEDDVRSTKVEYRGACLVGFDQDEYPDVRSGDEAIQAQVHVAIDGWVKHIDKRIAASGLQGVQLEVFCVPFPSVSEFRKATREALGA